MTWWGWLLLALGLSMALLIGWAGICATDPVDPYEADDEIHAAEDRAKASLARASGCQYGGCGVVPGIGCCTPHCNICSGCGCCHAHHPLMV